MSFVVTETDLIEPFAVAIDLANGNMPDKTNHIRRHLSDMRGYYADETALERLVSADSDPLHYEVFEVPVPQQDGHLMFCISRLLPGLVGDEYHMTKGHYHTRINTAETYLCLSGEGYMLMKTPAGECRWERFSPGCMVYVPPYWGHRSINTGDVPLVSHCVYPADAGHNYGDIASEGFPRRIFCRNGEIKIQ